MTVHTCMELSYFDNVMLKHFKWLRLFFWELRVVLKVGVGVKYIIIIVIYLYKKKHGNLHQFLYGTAGRELDSEANVYGFKPWSGQQVS